MKWFNSVNVAAALLASGAWGRSLSSGSLKFSHSSQPLEFQNKPRAASAQETCTTQLCKDYAKHIIGSLAPNYTAIDPCTEFDKYSCDGWRASHTYRPDQSYLSVTSVLSDTIRDLLHSILDGPYSNNQTSNSTQREYDVKNFNKLKTAYNTCLNESAIQSYGITPLKTLLGQFEKIYPLQKASSSNGTDELTDTIIWLSKNSVSGLVSAGPTADDMNPNTTIIYLGSSSLSLSKQLYNKSIVITNYTRSIAEMLQVLQTGKPIDEQPLPAGTNSSLYVKAQRIVAFEKKMSENLPDPEVSSDIEYYYKPRTVREVQAMVPEIGFERYLRGLAPSGYSITANRTVLVGDIDWYTRLSKTIIQGTPRETLHDYFEWRLISSWAGRLHRNYTAPTRRFSNLLSGRDPNVVSERWRTCVSEVDRGLGHILSGVFIERMFTKKDKELGDQIITDVKVVFSENLKNLDWMSNSTKAAAARKVTTIVQKVGFQTKNPNEENPQELDNYYKNLSITANFFENGLNLNKFNRDLGWDTLLKPTDKDQWDMTAPTVNAYYNPPLNEIVFPAGILQMPFFSGELPEYVSYGAFGATAGHELTHGFDDNGAKYDDEGRYRDWWDNSTTIRFQNKTQCFVKQYEQYWVEGLDGEKVPLNGKLTLGENIADSGGLNAAYRAWKKRESSPTAVNSQLPGLEKFTNDQLFFISYGNSWCEKARKEALLQQVYSDPHAPADKRVIGPVDNSEEFKKAFNCPVKKATCDLW